MEKGKALIKNTFIILLGKISTQFLSFFLLPLYTNFLSSKEYGTVDLITTYIALIVPVITLQLEMAMFRELIDVRDDILKKKGIISTGIISSISQLILILIILISASFFIQIQNIYLILLNISVVLISNQLLQISRGNGDNVAYSIACVISGIGTVFFNILFVVILQFKVEGILLSTVLANILAIIYLVLKNRIFSYLNFKYFDKKILKRMFKYSVPLVPNGLIWWIINISDRTLISIILGTNFNGIYAVSNKFSSILIQLYNVFNLSWTESASLHINDTDKDIFFSKVFNNVINIFFSLCILIVGFLPFVFSVLVSVNFFDSYNYIPILLLGMMFNIIVSFIGCIYVAKKLTKEISRTSLYSGILNILINLLLIKKIGIYAAAVSTLLSFFIMAIYRIIDVKKYVILKIDYRMFFFLSIVFILECVSYYCFPISLKIYTFIFTCIVILFYNRKYFYIKKNRKKDY